MSARPAAGRGPAARSRLFLWAGRLGIAVAISGFAGTFFRPLLTGTFRAAPIVYVHALFLFGWLGFFLLQSTLVHRRKLGLHRRMGWLGTGIALGVIVSALLVGRLASLRIAATGAIVQAEGELLVIMIEMLVFASLFGSALLLRRRPEVHKRLMLLALIGTLGPAWLRFRHYFPDVGNPLFVFSVLLADSLIVIAAAADLRRHGRVHPVYLTVGGAIILVHLGEVFLFDSRPFRAAAAALAGPWL